MITRVDHAFIAVGNLTDAVLAYRRIGFDVSPGGRHPRRGTENAIVRLGLDYLELIAIADEGEARDAGPSRVDLIRYLAQRDAGLATFVLASNDLTADVDRMQRAGLAVEGPSDGIRNRPDGTELSWRTAVPLRSTIGRPWPFLIEWPHHDAPSQMSERPGTHRNGALSIYSVAVAVRDLPATVAFYERCFGLSPTGPVEPMRDIGAKAATVDVNGFRIDLVQPGRSRGPLDEIIDKEGEGPFELRIRVESVPRLAVVIEAAGYRLTSTWSGVRIEEPDSSLRMLVFGEYR